jgi:hypothetical protein
MRPNTNAASSHLLLVILTSPNDVAHHAKIHQLQQAVLHEINELNQPRQGIMEMEVNVSLPSMSFQLFLSNRISAQSHSQQHDI